MISLGLGGCRCGFWDAVDVMRITVIVPHGLFGVVWVFFLWCGCFWVASVFIEHAGHWIPRQVFHEHLPFARIGMWGFSLFLCLHCVLGGLGVLDQGAGSTLRDPEVQLLLLGFFSPSHFGTGFFEQTCICYILFGRSLYIAAR